MNKSRRCVLCGAENCCGTMLMDQYVCLDCQPLLDDPRHKVFGCSLNRRFAKGAAREGLELIKAKD